MENSLIALYAKCGNLELAHQLFGRMPKRDVVSWNAMIVGYALSRCANETLAFFKQMLVEGMMPDSITLVSLLQACAHEGALQQGKWIHYYIIQTGFESDIFVLNSLVDMYAKCGHVEVARKILTRC